MVLLEDQRQQKNKHDFKHRYFSENGIRVNRCTLVCGDYQKAGDGSIAVDTKKDLLEVINDIQFRAMPKSEIAFITHQICTESHVEAHAEHLYHLIADDDSERFPETEITQYCFSNKLPDEVLKEAQMLYTKRHGFFHRGLIRAKEYGVKLYILIEEDGIHDIRDVFRWVNPRSQIYVSTGEIIGWTKTGRPKRKRVPKYPNVMKGQQLAKAMLTMEKKYCCKFEFCSPKDSGRKIIELLNG